LARLSSQQKEVVREKIIEKSRELFFEHGFKTTSTRMITKAVGIANGTLFNYFGSKGEILVEILSEGYVKKDEMMAKVNLEDKLPSELIFDFCANNMSIFLSMPKNMLKETIVVVVSSINQKYNLLSKIMELDIGFIDELNSMITSLINDEALRECNPTLLSEMIYSSIMYDYIFFILSEELEREDFLNRMKEKIAFLVGPYEKN
jgi:AcrR family transcriptional regulator